MSSYIGDTRRKKFKKIKIIFDELVSSYGLMYAIGVFLSEFSKQGFSVLKTDTIPQPIFSQKEFEKKYKLFLENMSKNLKSEFSNNSSEFKKFLIVLEYDHSNLQKIETTLNSINQQPYKNIHVIIISNNSHKDIIEDFQNKYPNLKILFSSESQFNSIEYDIAVFLKSGVIVNDFVFFKFAETFSESNCDIAYCDHDFIDQNSRHKNPFFKPDWSPYLFYGMDYLSPFYAIKQEVIKKIDMDSILSECFNFDLLLQCTEKTSNIFHIPLPLASLTEEHIETLDCQKLAITNHFKRMNICANIEPGILKNTLRMNFSLTQSPKVSILIPTKNNLKILKRCVDSIQNKTNYKNWEILIIDNSNEKPSKHKLENLKKYYSSLPWKIIDYPENFNFSKMNNLAVTHSTGDLLLFLNDDTKVIDPYWLDELVSIILQNNVGAVGPKLIFSDDTIQHAGMVFLKTGSGFHPSMKIPETDSGYHNQLNVMRDYSAVTGACLLTTRDIFNEVGGFDNLFDVYYGDSDLCLKIQKAGYKIIYTPFTKLLHEGSFSIRDNSASYFPVESHNDFIKKWPHLKNGDPFYNPNLGWNYDLI